VNLNVAQRHRVAILPRGTKATKGKAMRNLMILAALAHGGCALACGAPVETPPGETIGTAKQAVYLPSGYGTEGGTDSNGNKTTCDGDWANNECWVPNSKVFYTAFQAGTCSSWWQARFVDLWYELIAEVDYINSYLHEDATEWYLGPVPELWGEPLVAPGLIFNWRCQATDGIASFQPNSSNSDDIDAQGNDELRQYKGGTLRLDVADIESDVLWAASDDARRRRFARNVLRHEAWHQFGHGHEENGLMGGCDYWNEECWPTVTMYNRQACYNPSNGGLFADCD
jgi:hypothetical protein